MVLLLIMNSYAYLIIFVLKVCSFKVLKVINPVKQILINYITQSWKITWKQKGLTLFRFLYSQ
jgi:putative flippase GtrA